MTEIMSVPEEDIFTTEHFYNRTKKGKLQEVCPITVRVPTKFDFESYSEKVH